MFENEISGRVMKIADGYNAIKRLQTNLKSTVTENVENKVTKDDSVETFVSRLFQSPNNDTRDARNDEPDGDNTVDDTPIVSANETEPENVTEYDTNELTDLNQGQDETRDASDTSSLNSVSTAGEDAPDAQLNVPIHQLSIHNIFIIGKEKMIEKDMPSIRARARARMHRAETFIHDLYSDVMNSSQNIKSKIDQIHISKFMPISEHMAMYRSRK